MKNLILALLVLSFACSPSSEKTTQEEAWSVFGQDFESEEVIAAADVKNHLNESDSIQITLTGEVEAACKMKGCWMTVKTAEGETMRVTFQDYGFFVPKNAAGAEAIFTGVAKRKVTDVETLKHFAEDEGKTQEEIDAITEDKEELVFVATGVKMRNIPTQENTTTEEKEVATE